MRPLAELRPARPFAGIFCDIDDTLTDTGHLVPSRRGRIVPEAYAALCAAADAGLRIVPVTGRPAGWAESLALLWPVDAIVAENGGVALIVHRPAGRRRHVERLYWDPDEVRAEQRQRLEAIVPDVLAAVPGTRLTDDSRIRYVDLAFDVGESVQLTPAEIAEIAAIIRRHGARVLISTVHAHAFYGDHDKARMLERVVAHCYGETLAEMRDRYVFVGDSPNDQAGFAYFPTSVGVANVRRYAAELSPPPAYVTRAEGGQGFAELVAHLGLR